MITDVFMILGSVSGLGVIAWIGRRVYLAELGRRCGWCFGTGREWGEEYAARCPACAGTGVTRAAASVRDPAPGVDIGGSPRTSSPTGDGPAEGTTANQPVGFERSSQPRST